MNYGEKVIVDISGYYCFSNLTNKKRQVGCKDYNSAMEEIKNLTFSKMRIMGGSEVGLSNDLIYNGDFLNNITKVLN